MSVEKKGERKRIVRLLNMQHGSLCFTMFPHVSPTLSMILFWVCLLGYVFFRRFLMET